jgi:hypothetical protein
LTTTGEPSVGVVASAALMRGITEGVVVVLVVVMKAVVVVVVVVVVDVDRDALVM